MRKTVLVAAATCTIFIAGCKEQPAYELVYPVQASKQQIHRIDGVRFISTTDTPELSLIILNNPVPSGAFADIAFSITNSGGTSLKLTRMPQGRIKSGPLPVLGKESYEKRISLGERYLRPEGYEKLMPAMQKFGCAAQKSENTTSPFDLTASQKQVWKHYKRYQTDGTLDSGDYFEGFTLAPGETKSAFVRIDLPKLETGSERETMLFTLCPEEHSCKKVRLVIQPLNNK